MTNSINIKLNPNIVNDIYRPYFNCMTPTQIFFGSASAGKSKAIVGQRTVYDLLRGDRNYLILRNVAKYSKISTYNEINQVIDDWKVRDYFKINKSTLTITCANGFQIYFGGLDDVEKLKSILPEKGVLTDILIEEATETDYNDVKQLTKRLRGRSKYPKRMTLLFNPVFKTHWIYNHYFKGKWADGDKTYEDDHLSILHTTYKDNRFLELEDIHRLEFEEDKYFYDVYTLGNWGQLGGVIFTNWRIADLSGMMRVFDNIRNGLDFGYGADPCAFNRMHYDKKKKKIYIFEEMHQHEMTNPMIADWLKPIIKKEYITCDSSEPKSIAELRDLGINAIGARKGQGSVNHGIQFLQQHEIIIDRGCQETINEIQQYKWKQLKSGETINVPIGKDDHHIDCFAGETILKTNRGDVRIDSLCDNDKVLTRGGYKNILWHENTKIDKIYKIVLSDGTELRCTRTHKFITTNNEKVPLYKLKRSDILFKRRSFKWLENLLFIKEKDIGGRKREETRTILKDQIRAKVNCFIEKYMKIIMERSQMDSKSTTSMVINKITQLKIWRCYQEKNTSRNIKENVRKSKEKTLITSATLQRNGIVVKKVLNGIQDMRRSHIKNEFLSSKNVLCVGRNIVISRDPISRSFVPIDADLNSAEILESIMKKGHVCFVEKISKLINIVKHRRVRVRAVIDTGIYEKVYNLQVDSKLHEYYANGVLVGNCSRYALEGDMPSIRTRAAVKSVGGDKPNEVVPDKPDLKPGQEAIPIYEGSTIVGWEIVGTATGRYRRSRRGITGTMVR